MTFRRTAAAGCAALALALTGCSTGEEVEAPEADPPATSAPADDAEDPTTAPPEDQETTVPVPPSPPGDDDTASPAPPDDGEDTTAPPAADPPGDGEVVDPGDATGRPEVQQAIADASERARVDAANITVLEYAGVTWRNGAIGCPGEGQMYTQALVPGARLILDVDGEEMAYHSGGRQPLTYCADPQEPAPGAGLSTS